VSGVNVTLQNPASINVGALASSSDYQLTLTSGDFEALKAASARSKSGLDALPQIEDVNSNRSCATRSCASASIRSRRRASA